MPTRGGWATGDVVWNPNWWGIGLMVWLVLMLLFALFWYKEFERAVDE